MSYQYRWVYAAGVNVFLMIVIYFVDILPLNQEYQDLQKKLSELQVTQAEPVVVRQMQPGPQLQQQLLTLLYGMRGNILDLQQNANTFDMQIEADFTHMMHLLRLFSESESKVRVENFNLKLGSNRRLQLAIRLIVNEVPAYRQYSINKYSVFCPANRQDIFVKKPTFLAESARMVGVYQSEAEQVVIVMWPSGLVGQYALGSAIGADTARIVAVNQEGCLLQIGDRLVTMPYEKE